MRSVAAVVALDVDVTRRADVDVSSHGDGIAVSLDSHGHGEWQRTDRQRQGKGRSGLEVVLHRAGELTANTMALKDGFAHHLFGGLR